MSLIHCPQCEAANAKDAKYCGQCAYSLAGSSTMTEVAESDIEAIRGIRDEASEIRKPCRICGESIAVDVERCRYCGEPVVKVSRMATTSDDDLRAVKRVFIGLAIALPWVAFCIGAACMLSENERKRSMGKFITGVSSASLVIQLLIVWFLFFLKQS